MAMGWHLTPSLAHGGGYGGALGPATAVVGVHPQIRVRLVFMEDLAAYVMRQRGFGSCWFLLPRNLRLVGDLMHEIRGEFELGECCPDGLVLLLDGFHVLPNQEIGVLRDHDVIAVQCAPVESGVTRANEKKSTLKTSKKKKRKLADVEKKSTGKDEKKLKKTKHSSDRLETAAASVQVKVKNAQSEPVPAPLSKTVADSSSSDSERSSSSSSSSSSDSDSEEDIPPSTKKPMRKEGMRDAEEADKQNVNGRARRRRRPRRRSKADSTGKTPAEATPPAKAAPQPVSKPEVSTEKRVEPEHTPLRPLRIRGLPPSTANPETRNHVRFDGNSTIADKSTVHVERAVPPQLRKYGPHAPSFQRGAQNENHHSSNERHHGNSEEPAKPKAKSVDMWKRPYEIIASISDSNDPAVAKTPDMSELLAAYPAKPLDTKSLPTSTGLQPDDVVAYKTVTLCMETWQPIVSEWQCGRVTSVDEGEQVAAFGPLSLRRDGSSLRWQPVHQESMSVSLGELSEVRYLQGPTHQALANE